VRACGFCLPADASGALGWRQLSPIRQFDAKPLRGLDLGAKLANIVAFPPARPTHGSRSAWCGLGVGLIGEKLLNYAEGAVTQQKFARQLPRFVAEIRNIFSAANADGSPEEGDARYHQIMLPYQMRVGAELVALRAMGSVHIVSMHTCTKQLRGGTFRPWQVGVISGPDERMRRLVFEHLQAGATGFVIGENEPYIVNMTNDYTLPVYAEAQGIPYVEFEFRNDMFGDDASREEICRMTAESETRRDGALTAFKGYCRSAATAELIAEMGLR
jgi:hypothetical protein